MIQGVIFDVDGTLLDSMQIWDHAAKRYLKREGIEAEDGLSDILFSMTMMEGAEYVIKAYNLKKNPEEIIEGINEIVFQFYRDEVQEKAGVTELLEKFQQKRIKMAVATSTDRFLIEAAFKRLGLMKYFERIFTCSEVGASKNVPKIFLEASNVLGTDVEHTWVFEDGLYALRTAKNAGFHTVGVYDRASDKDQEKLREEAEIYLENIKEWEEKYRQYCIKCNIEKTV